MRKATGRLYRIDTHQQESCACVHKTVIASRVEGAVDTWISMRLFQDDVLDRLLEEHRAR